MKIISYLNDPYSIEQTLSHLIKLFTQAPSSLDKHISKRGLLSLKFGEMSINGKFFELKFPKKYRAQFPTNKKLTSELLYFDILVKQHEFDHLLTQLCSAITEYNRSHNPLWSDQSSFFGINILIPLAMKRAEQIPALIHFLTSTNLSKEVSLSDDLNRVFNCHPWSPLLIDLLAARTSILKGKYGHHHIEELLNTDDLKSYLKEENNQNLLLEKVTEYALLDYSEHSGEIEPEAIISNALAPFKNLSSNFAHKCHFLKHSFIENFPNYLPCNYSTMNGHLNQ